MVDSRISVHRKPLCSIIDIAIRTIINHRRWMAHSRKRVWQLTYEQSKQLMLSNCHYCGLEPSNTQTYISHGRIHGKIKYSGIDRVDSNHGYIPSNVVSCCKTCNRAKSNTPYRDFMGWIKRIAALHGGA